MSTRCTLMYGGDKARNWRGEVSEVEPYTHVWSDMIDDRVYVQVLTDPPDVQPLHDEDGNVVGHLVTLRMPPATSLAMKASLRHDPHR